MAHDGTTALEWLVERPFSLVLTDLCLPGIGGLDLIREIRHRDLPVTVDRDDRPRLDRLGRRGDEAGRLRLHPSSRSTPIRLELLVEQALEDRRLHRRGGRPAATGSAGATPTTTCWAGAPG